MTDIVPHLVEDDLITYKAVQVKWLDHQEPAGGPWYELDTVESLAWQAEAITVGYLVYQDKDVIVLANTLAGTLCSRPLVIGKASVISMDDLYV